MLRARWRYPQMLADGDVVPDGRPVYAFGETRRLVIEPYTARVVAPGVEVERLARLDPDVELAIDVTLWGRLLRKNGRVSVRSALLRFLAHVEDREAERT
jgi:hypothetical protein